MRKLTITIEVENLNSLLRMDTLGPDGLAQSLSESGQLLASKIVFSQGSKEINQMTGLPWFLENQEWTQTKEEVDYDKNK